MISSLKGIFAARPMDECVPLSNGRQQNLRFGFLAAKLGMVLIHGWCLFPEEYATTEESTLRPLDEIDEGQIPGEGIKKEQTNLNLAELKSFANDLPDLTSDLPHVDAHQFLAQLKEELKQRQTVEMKTA
ncbi:6846_t:CDS:2 [Ambispora gerdemannii]|uniref:6846_t:CDS:1 n=1 Tax=Ambispora gerdemannii TaxID=144530 RepID=A0A9N9FMP2_9GLOM|nr:6846_t:CDS:2 [Ambispora gerdemannii]